MGLLKQFLVGAHEPKVGCRRVPASEPNDRNSIRLFFPNPKQGPSPLISTARILCDIECKRYLWFIPGTRDALHRLQVRPSGCCCQCSDPDCRYRTGFSRLLPFAKMQGNVAGSTSKTTRAQRVGLAVCLGSLLDLRAVAPGA